MLSNIMLRFPFSNLTAKLFSLRFSTYTPHALHRIRATETLKGNAHKTEHKTEPSSRKMDKADTVFTKADISTFWTKDEDCGRSFHSHNLQQRLTPFFPLKINYFFYKLFITQKKNSQQGFILYKR